MNNKNFLRLLFFLILMHISFSININTDKSKRDEKDLKQYYSIKKENTYNKILSPPDWVFLFKLEFLNPTYEIHIEKLSGDIILTTNKTNFSYKDYFLFSLSNDKDIIDLKIKAKQNSVYDIKYCYIFKEYNDRISYNKYIVPQNGNYLFNFNFEEHSDVTLDFYTGVGSGLFYTIFYPINCPILILYKNPINENMHRLFGYKSPDNIVLYQDISEYGYYNILSLKNTNSCMIYTSSYSLDDNENNKSENSIILRENNPQVFLFNKMIAEIKYSFYFGELNNDINIEITLLNGGNFIITFIINNIYKEKYYNISSSKNIKLTCKDWKNICKKGKICKIFFIMKKLDDIENDSFIKININSTLLINNQQVGNIKFSKLNIWIIITFVLFIGIIFGVKSRKNKRILNEKENLMEMKEIEQPFNMR